jgi:ActR/RegA family two-component response regulator
MMVDIVGAAQEDVIVFRVVAVDVARSDRLDVADIEAFEVEQLQRAVEDKGVADVMVVVEMIGRFRVPAYAVVVVDLALGADHQDVR